MPTTRIPLTGGPSKDDLLRAAASDDHILATFGTPHGMIEADINAIEPIGPEGVDFTVWGQLASTHLKGAVFTGTYNCKARTGRLALKLVDH